jgi:hypothetical protein
MADLTIEELRDMHGKAYVHNQTTRIAAADDLLFQFVSQWDSSLLDNFQLGYKGQFDILTKAIRENMSDLRTNQVQVEFEPKAESREADADLLNGIYLSVDRENTSIEAYDNASQECVTCGLGGWELYTEYESNRAGDRNQVIKRRPWNEFNNNAFPDPNAKLLDKSDAMYWSLLEPYSEEGYKKLYEELTGEITDCDPNNFASPESSYVFPWVTGNELYYVVRFYHKTLVKDKILTFTDPFGQMVKYSESSLTNRGEDGDIDLRSELKAQGFTYVSSKQIKRWQVKLYIASGEKILKSYVIPGEHIPVVPMYGERQFVEGEETYRGTVRLAKDPQRLHNFLLSYYGDFVSRSGRPKPVLLAEQVAGFENMYNENGPENNFPYVLQNRLAPDGSALPIGPIAIMPVGEIPKEVAQLVEMTRNAVEDVANPGLPKGIMDSDLSGHAIEQLQARLDNQSQVYQDHKKHAKRYDAAVFASMASEVFDSNRKVTITLPDGSRKVEEIMSTIMDEQTGELIVLNDLTGLEFNVYANIGPSYDSSREKTFDRLGEMAALMAQTDPAMANLIHMQQLTLMDGIGTKDIREYARKKLLLAGVIEPETDEDKEFMDQQAQQPKEPDASQMYAQAELLKGQADLLEQQREGEKDKVQFVLDQEKLRTDKFNAETKRIEANNKAEAMGDNRHLTRAKIAGQHLDNVHKMHKPFESFRARANA